MALGQILSKSISRNERFEASTTRSSISLSKNINRLLSAAVVSPRFQQLLLNDPIAALALGYNGEKFHLTPAEYAAVTSLRVNSIRDFAAQLLRKAQQAATPEPAFVTEPQGELRLAEVIAR
jgi:hypothetical protein